MIDTIYAELFKTQRSTQPPQPFTQGIYTLNAVTEDGIALTNWEPCVPPTIDITKYLRWLKNSVAPYLAFRECGPGDGEVEVMIVDPHVMGFVKAEVEERSNQ